MFSLHSLTLIPWAFSSIMKRLSSCALFILCLLLTLDLLCSFPDFCFFLPRSSGLHPWLGSGAPRVTQLPSGCGPSMWCASWCPCRDLVQHLTSLPLVGETPSSCICEYHKPNSTPPFPFLPESSWWLNPIDLWETKFLPSFAYHSPSSHTWTAPLLRFPDSSLSSVYLVLCFQSYS